MLSGIQVFLEKNRKWLFGFLLVVIVVPFVFTIGSTPGLVSGKKTQKMTLFGYDLNDRSQLEQVVRNGAISIALRSGNEENAWMESAQGYAFYRLLLLSIARDLRLPAPSEEILGGFVKTLPLFCDENHNFKAETYNTYLKNWKENFGKSYSLRSLLIEDYLCDQVRGVMMKSGFVLPKESELFFKHLKATYNFDYLVVKNEEKLPEKVHENALREYYDAHKDNYTVGQRADVTLLFFENKKYREQLPVISEKDVELYFDEHKDSFADKEGKVPELKDIKDRVRTALETEHLNRLANDSASQFVLDVYDKNIALNSEEWNRLVDKNDARCIHSIEPFTRDNIPEKKGLPKDVLRHAFDLNEDHFLSEPSSVKNGVVVVALNKFLPSYIPEMDAVREKVIADVKAFEREEAFHKKIDNLCKYLNDNGSKEKLAEKGFQVQKLENFTLEGSFSSLGKLLQIQSIFDFSKNLNAIELNQWSKAYAGQEDSVVLFCCRDKKLPEVDITSEDFKKFDENFVNHQRSTQSETLLREILEDTMNRSGSHR